LASGKFVTHGINFDVNKSTTRPESIGVLNEVAAYLEANPSIHFEIDGHTDSDGDEASNQTLSIARAEAVKKHLVVMGVSESQLKTNGFGESQPIDLNATAEGKANNRRVEFVKI
jgi:OmpA-OmpF porin, OOP family